MPVARLSSRALIAVTGADARPFLHNLLTQDVEGLAPGDLRFPADVVPLGDGRLGLSLGRPRPRRAHRRG